MLKLSLTFISIFVAGLCFFEPQASAISEQECGSVDLRDKGKSMYEAPNFDQGSADYCWAFAGTQLTSSILNLQNQKNFNFKTDAVTLSPSVTMNHALASGIACPTPCGIVKSTLQAKKGCAVGDAVFSDGKATYFVDTGLPVTEPLNCDLKKMTIDDVDDFVHGLTKDTAEKIEEARHKLPFLATRLSEKNPTFNTPARQRSLKNFMERKVGKGLKFADVTNATIAPNCMDLENTARPLKGSSQLNRVLASVPQDKISCLELRTSDFDTVIRGDSQCASATAGAVVDKKEIVKRINDVFSSGSGFPVAIDYCYAFLFDGEPTDGPRICNLKSGRETTDHKSLLIGRRYNTKTEQCEFLLRNTWGTDCEKLHPNFQASCREEKRQHKAADIWIPESLATKVIHGASLLKQAK